MIMELAYPGIFGQDKTPVTEQHLREAVETFKGDAPVTLGHELADWMPRFGDVKSLSFNPANKKLYGDVALGDLLQEAYDAGLYKSWSIGLPVGPDGKRYLHHLAFLGAVPPKIKDLQVMDGKVVNMADMSKWTIEFSDTHNKEEQRMAEENKTDPQGQPLAGDHPPAGGGNAAAGQDKNPPVNLADAMKPFEEKMKVMEAQMRNAKKTALTAAIAGKVPAAKHGLVLQLADQLPMEENIELADEKGTKSKVSAFDLLMKIFEAIPAPVKTGMMELGDLPGDKDGQPVNYQGLAAKF